MCFIFVFLFECEISESFRFMCHQPTSYIYIYVYNGYLRITFLFHFEIRSVTHEKLQMRATHEYWTNISEKSYIQSVWWISMCRKWEEEKKIYHNLRFSFMILDSVLFCFVLFCSIRSLEYIRTTWEMERQPKWSENNSRHFGLCPMRSAERPFEKFEFSSEKLTH